MPARPTSYHSLVLVCGRASHRVHPKMGASFWLPLGSYTGTFSPLLWTTPNLGCTPLTGRIPDDWGDLPDHWRLRPGRSVWPHLTDNQLTCTHNNPGYTPYGGVRPGLGDVVQPDCSGFFRAVRSGFTLAMAAIRKLFSAWWGRTRSVFYGGCARAVRRSMMKRNSSRNYSAIGLRARVQT